MGGHDSGEIVVDERAVGPDIRLQIGEFAPIHRQRDMRIGNHRAMAGKVLGYGRHPRLAHPRQGGYREGCHGVRIAVKGTVADDFAHTVVEVDAGCKAEIHPHRAQFAGHQPADRMRKRQSVAPVLVKSPTQETCGRKTRKALAKALHAPPFVVHGDQKMRRAQRANRRRQCGDLPRIAVIARE